MTDGPRTRSRRRPTLTAVLASASLLVGCANFEQQPVAFTDQPTLTAAAPQPLDEIPGMPGSQSAPPPESGGSTTAEPPDPCKPTDPAIVAACLDAPWGLAVLPGGTSALVGERTTGRLLTVASGAEPAELATIDGLDSTGDGGLLGIALSPSYAEDGLVYLYVTTATDNRILRLAGDDKPKPIFTGIPKGKEHNGGRIAFGLDGFLYVATGDAGDPAEAADPASLSGKVLRIDEFGNPVGDNETEGSGQSPVYAVGLTEPTGMCLLPTGAVGVIEPRRSADVLVPLTSGADLAKTEPLWTYPHTEGGAVDCASVESTITTTSLRLKQALSLTLAAGGAFAGEPVPRLTDQYGRLLSAAPGAENTVWMTTSNKDGQGEPQDRDDLVIVMTDAGGGGEGSAD